MKIKKHYFYRQLRQLRFLSKKLNRLVKTGKFYQLSIAKQQKQIQKFKKLIQGLEGTFSASYLQKVTTGVALTLGLGIAVPNAQAQISFADPIENPFGFVPHPGTTDGITFGGIADLDTDGDLDLLVSYYYYEASGDGTDHRIGVYYENSGSATNPDFGGIPPIIGCFGLDTLNEISVTLELIDIDNDGDYDLFVGGSYIGLEFYENTGTATTPIFETKVTNPMGFVPVSIFIHPVFADIDNDGDQDLLCSGYYGNLNYYENIGSLEQAAFALPTSNPFGVDFGLPNNDYLGLHQFSDLDYDGDLDLIFTVSTYDGDNDTYISDIFFQENIGSPENPSFDTRIENPFSISLPDIIGIPIMADMDNDGDDDLIITGEYYEGTMYYYENTTIISKVLNFSTETHIAISPNPSSHYLQLEANFSTKTSNIKITASNTLGQVLKQKSIFLQNNHVQENWDISNWQSGVYFIKFQSYNKSRTLKFIKQ